MEPTKSLRKLLILLILVTGMTGLQPGFSSAADQRAIEMMDFDEFSPWLSRETDSVYVINFWATWCAPCVREIPAFEQLHATYADSGVKVLLVSLDTPAQVENRVIPFIERMDIQSQVLLLDDPISNRWIPLVSEEWSGAIPATVIYSRDFRGFYEREFKFEELEAIVKPLIRDL